jgi:alkenylglycerophosphocholine/alkenylglycerophosphoethanolamine hydrolase
MKKISYIFIIFLTLVALYFSPIHLPSKLAGPVTFLGLMALVDFKRIGLLMGLGLMLSALGDWQGTQGNFMGQMAFFGVAHVAYICYFVSRLRNKPDWKVALGWAIPCILIGVFAFIKVVPMVPSGIIKTGVIVYCLLILTMLWSSLLQKDWLFALGAALFVLSDFILAWNKFVSPIDYASWCIMVPYYGAQWCLFYRATSVASGACSCTSQGK